MAEVKKINLIKQLKYFFNSASNVVNFKVHNYDINKLKLMKTIHLIS